MRLRRARGSRKRTSMTVPIDRARGPGRVFRLIVIGLLVGGAIWLGLSLRGGHGSGSSGGGDWANLAGSPRSDVSVGERVIVVLKAPALADRVRAAGGLASDVQEREWTAEAAAEQKTIIAKLALRGAAIVPEFSFTRVINGFSAALDAGSIAVLERSPEVRGVYPVRVTYPASIDVQSLGNPAALIRGYHPQVSLPPYDGRGVTIALLDTGVDRQHEYLHGHALEGLDVVGGDPGAGAAPDPDDRSQLERHGTQLAGIVIGPAALGGIAPGASILPIRVAGWQRDTSGTYEVYGRTDQLIAGLERAVDPNGDGDAHDGARVALVGVSAPLAGFGDGPEARAVAGATALDTLVVAPAGNDGPAGEVYGSIGAPGGASQALTVGAVDLRPRSERVRVVVRSGLDVLFDGAVSLGGSVAPSHPLASSLSSPRTVPSTVGELVPAPDLSQFFDSKGYSLVAGKAALVPAGDDPRTGARNAGLAGATAVVLYGTSLPSGALGLDENISVPVVSVPARVGAEAAARLRKGDTIEVSIGAPYTIPNPDLGEIASFSSQGLSFAGDTKPNLVAAGVGVATSDAGMTENGLPAFATVTGSSASAAVVAGAAALLTQARPNLDESELASLLSGTARPLSGEPVTAQGAGELDLGAAVQASIATPEQSLAFPLLRGGRRRAKLSFEVRNLSLENLVVAAHARCEGSPAWLRVRIAPQRRLVRKGRHATFTLKVNLTARTSDVSTEGIVTLRASDGHVLRVPWSLRVGSRAGGLIAGVSLSRHKFGVSESSSAILTLELGRVSGELERRIEPAAKVDLELWNSDHRFLGVLARMRDVLPGHYVFGLTGRDPAGAALSTGDYTLRIVAFPSGGGRASRRTLKFSIEPETKTASSSAGPGG
jgi:hypothetical protein